MSTTKGSSYISESAIIASCTNIQIYICIFVFVVVKKKKKEKRQRRVNQNALSVEELLDSPTFKKFSSCMESILDTAEDVNFGTLDPSKSKIFVRVR